MSTPDNEKKLDIPENWRECIITIPEGKTIPDFHLALKGILDIIPQDATTISIHNRPVLDQETFSNLVKELYQRGAEIIFT